jgi:hypothetical protein
MLAIFRYQRISQCTRDVDVDQGALEKCLDRTSHGWGQTLLWVKQMWMLVVERIQM